VGNLAARIAARPKTDRAGAKTISNVDQQKGRGRIEELSMRTAMELQNGVLYASEEVVEVVGGGNC
jgi:hypothetical protein